MSMTEKTGLHQEAAPPDHGGDRTAVRRSAGDSEQKSFPVKPKNPAVGPVDKITQVLRIPIHYLLDDELPIEYHVSTSTDDGILLLSSEEIQISHENTGIWSLTAKRAVDTMTETSQICRLAGWQEICRSSGPFAM